MWCVSKSARENEQFDASQKESVANDHSAAYLKEMLRLKKKIRVYTDMNELKPHLSEEKYQFVDELFDADVIFMRKHFKDYK